jgi:hypothetical protein
MAKHYIRLDNNNNITKGFTDYFEEALSTDVCIQLDAGNQFELLGMINPFLVMDYTLISLYKYIDGNVVIKTDEEIQAEIKLIPAPKTQIELMQEQIDILSAKILVMTNA